MAMEQLQKPSINIVRLILTLELTAVLLASATVKSTYGVLFHRPGSVTKYKLGIQSAFQTVTKVHHIHIWTRSLSAHKFMNSCSRIIITLSTICLQQTNAHMS